MAFRLPEKHISGKAQRLFRRWRKFSGRVPPGGFGSDPLAPRFGCCCHWNRQFTAGNHIPDGNAILKEQLFFLRNRLWNLPAGESRQEFPEAVLRMAVIKLLLPGFHRGKGPENQNPGIFVINRLKCMGYFFICFHRFFLFYRSEARPSAKASRRCRSSGPIFSKRLISSS